MFHPNYKNVNPYHLDAVKRYWDRWGMARGAKDYTKVSLNYLADTGRMTEDEVERTLKWPLSTMEHQQIQDRARDARMEDGDQSMWSDSWANR